MGTKLDTEVAGYDACFVEEAHLTFQICLKVFNVMTYFLTLHTYDICRIRSCICHWHDDVGTLKSFVTFGKVQFKVKL